MKKSLAYYLIPSIIVSILSGIYVIIDGIFIGIYIGDDGLSAINIAWPITALIQTVGLAIGTSCGVNMSIYEGKNKLDEKRKIEWLSISLLFLSTIVLMIFLFLFNKPLLRLFGAENDVLMDYGSTYLSVIILGSLFQVFGMGLAPILRNKGKVKTVMFAMILGTLCNFIGDYIFIALFNLELAGAALASIAGQAATGIICLICLITNKDMKINFDLKLVLQIFKVFVSPFILTYSASILLIITNLVCMHYGGSKCVATYTIYSYIVYIIQASSAGCSDGAQPLISYYYGCNDDKNLNSIRKKLYIFSTIFVGLIVVIFWALKNKIGLLFGVSEEVLELYNDGYLFFISGLIFICFVKINSSYLYSTNNTTKANVLVLIDPLLINPLLLFTFPLFLGINGIWFSYSLSQIILSIFGFLMIFWPKKGCFEPKNA